jgi:SOS regulatory protein LexA
MPITKRQKETLDFIKAYTEKKGYAPSLENIKKYFGLASVSTAHHHVRALMDAGYLGKEVNQPRAINVYETDQLVQIPLLGTIAAGHPIEAIEGREIIGVSRAQLPRSLEHIYALRVAGNSMIEENINDGDIVLVQRKATAENGEKVVALINNNEATLKTFFREKGRIRLQPANKKMEPIIVRRGNAGFAIQGIVLGVIKNINPAWENSDIALNPSL